MEENNKHIDELVNETLESLDGFHGISASAAFEQRVLDSVLGDEGDDSFLMFRYVAQVVIFLLILNILVVYGQVRRGWQPKLKSQSSTMVSEGRCPEIYSFLLEDGA